MSELVQIQLNWYPYGNTKRQEPCLLPRPKEVTDLVDALSQYWGRVGVHAVCRDCFAGKLDKPVHAHGCCSGCPNLGHSKCLAKPIGCAAYWCHRKKTENDYGVWSSLAFDVVYGILRWDTGIPTGCYSGAVKREALHDWQDWQLKLLRIARHAVDALALEPVCTT